MSDCIFCKIIVGEIAAVKIWEDDKFIAILDLNPNTRGMALVITKEHYDSYVFKMPVDIYSEFTLAAKKVGELLEKGLDVNRVAMVMEGMGVNHAHIKLYPMYGVAEEFRETWAKDRVYFESYPGYISTQMGPEVSAEEREKIAEGIRGGNK